MKLFFIKQGPLQVNTYFLVNEESKTAVVIDSGENYKKVKQVAFDNGFTIKHILLTHCHFDHAGNVKKFQDEGVLIYASRKDSLKLLNDDNLGSRFGRNVEKCNVDYMFDDGEILSLESISIKVIATPGHTDGSVSFVVGDLLFTGDTLFYECVGRTDFVTGSSDDLVKSVEALFNLQGDYKVFPGHREFTTLQHEREFNFLKIYD